MLKKEWLNRYVFQSALIKRKLSPADLAAKLSIHSSEVEKWLQPWPRQIAVQWLRRAEDVLKPESNALSYESEELSARHRIDQPFLINLLNDKKKRSRITYDGIASLIGIDPKTLRRWRKIEDPKVEFENILKVSAFFETDERHLIAEHAPDIHPGIKVPVHWEIKGRGIDPSELSDPGMFFTGREAARRVLIQWLSGNNSKPLPHRMRVVTGLPGSGKSALLGFLTKMSDRLFRDRYRDVLDTPPPDIFPQENTVEIALNAQGKTLNQIIDQLCKASGGSAPSPIDEEYTYTAIETITHDRNSQKPWRIVIDTLDEAIEPEKIASELLKPLGGNRAVRLVVATRDTGTLLHHLGDNIEVINLDKAPYFNEQDIQDYLVKRLLYTPDTRITDPDQAQIIAAEVARQAEHFLFLYAQVVGRLIATGHIDTTAPDWGEQIPRDLETAFEKDLNRFGTDIDNQRVKDLLLPLAYAEGRGLPQDETLWLALANSFHDLSLDSLSTSQRYIRADIDKFKKQADFFLIEDEEAYYPEHALQKPIPTYRLYHSEFAKYLRSVPGKGDQSTLDENRQHRITDVLKTLIPLKENGTRNWEEESGDFMSYSRLHLSTHAVKAGDLDRFIEDPLFLITAEPDRLLTALPSVRTSEGRHIADVYHKAHYSLSMCDSTESKTSHLDLYANILSCSSLLKHLQNLPRSWSTHQALMKSTSPFVVISRQPTLRVLLSRLDNELVMITMEDKGFSIWSLRTVGVQRFTIADIQLGWIEDCKLTELAGEPLLMFWGEKGVGVCSLQNARPLTPVIIETSQLGWIKDCKLTELAGEPLLMFWGEKGVGVCSLQNARPLTPVIIETSQLGWIKDCKLTESTGEPLLILRGNQNVGVCSLQNARLSTPVIIETPQLGEIDDWKLIESAGEPLLILRGNQNVGVCSLQNARLSTPVVIETSQLGWIEHWKLTKAAGEPLLILRGNQNVGVCSLQNDKLSAPVIIEMPLPGYWKLTESAGEPLLMLQIEQIIFVCSLQNARPSTPIVIETPQLDWIEDWKLIESVGEPLLLFWGDKGVGVCSLQDNRPSTDSDLFIFATPDIINMHQLGSKIKNCKLTESAGEPLLLFWGDKGVGVCSLQNAKLSMPVIIETPQLGQIESFELTESAGEPLLLFWGDKGVGVCSLQNARPLTPAIIETPQLGWVKDWTLTEAASEPLLILQGDEGVGVCSLQNVKPSMPVVIETPQLGEIEGWELTESAGEPLLMFWGETGVGVCSLQNARLSTPVIIETPQLGRIRDCKLTESAGEPLLLFWNYKGVGVCSLQNARLSTPVIIETPRPGAIRDWELTESAGEPLLMFWGETGVGVCSLQNARPSTPAIIETPQLGLIKECELTKSVGELFLILRGKRSVGVCLLQNARLSTLFIIEAQIGRIWSCKLTELAGEPLLMFWGEKGVGVCSLQNARPLTPVIIETSQLGWIKDCKLTESTGEPLLMFWGEKGVGVCSLQNARPLTPVIIETSQLGWIKDCKLTESTGEPLLILRGNQNVGVCSLQNARLSTPVIVETPQLGEIDDWKLTESAGEPLLMFWGETGAGVCSLQNAKLSTPAIIETPQLGPIKECELTKSVGEPLLILWNETGVRVCFVWKTEPLLEFDTKMALGFRNILLGKLNNEIVLLIRFSFF